MTAPKPLGAYRVKKAPPGDWLCAHCGKKYPVEFVVYWPSKRGERKSMRCRVMAQRFAQLHGLVLP